MIMTEATRATNFFDQHQRATVEAAMARVIPTDDLPGAREAGTVDFVDRYLSGIDYIYAKPDGSGFESLSGRSAAAWQRRVELARRSTSTAYANWTVGPRRWPARTSSG